MPKVLIVDDDEDVRTILADALAERGYKVEMAGDGQEALKVLERFHPDCILLDMIMPVMDGVEFLSAAKLRQLLRCPVLVITGSTERAFIVEPLVEQVMHKPFDLSTLVRALDECARHYEQIKREARKKKKQ